MKLNHGDVIEVGYTQLKVFISKEIKTQIVPCTSCGVPIDIIEEETPPDYCLTCEKKLEEKNRRSKPEKPQQIFCQCGKDLSGPANSDGRAEEFRGLVRYSCGKCVKSVKEGKEAGKEIAGYLVLKVLGEGAIGKVFQVYHPPTARVLALKIMLRLTARELVKRFEREIRFMKELRHRNTLRFIDSGVSGEGPYLVTELASKGNLEDLVESKGGFLPSEEAVHYIMESLDGLEFIHRKKIVHRDLKPPNILLQDSGNGRLIPRIADFGLAKKYSEAGGSRLTQLGVGIGTLMYMAPEQVKDTGSVREPADIYSMGVTLYYLLTGSYSFNFPTPLDIMRFMREQRHKAKNMEEALAHLMQMKKIKSPQVIIVTDEPIPIRERKPDIPIELAKVVDKAVRKDIGARFQSAREFREALHKAAGLT